MRGQTSLPALGVAFLLLTAGMVVGITAANGALDAATRQALDRQAAVGLSERLVGSRSSLTARANVLNRTKLSGLSARTLRDRYGLSPGAGVRVTVDDRTLVSAGEPGGVTVERLVLVQHRDRRTLTPSFDRSRTVTLPRRSPTLGVSLSPPANTTVRSVRVNGRVRLHNASGLNGSYRLPISAVETATVRVDATGRLTEGAVRIRYRPARTEKARLAVTVDG